MNVRLAMYVHKYKSDVQSTSIMNIKKSQCLHAFVHFVVWLCKCILEKKIIIIGKMLKIFIRLIC